MSSMSPAPCSFSCPYGCRSRVVRRGHFLRERDRKIIQRFLCRGCHRSYSEARFDPCFRQKKRDLNPVLFRLLTGGYSQRRAALDLGVDRKTVVRKFLFLGKWAALLMPELNRRAPLVRVMEFDDLETSEHSKCKPLSITLAVEHGTRRILGFEVASMPAKGLLTKIALKKYGRRPDERAGKRRKLFEKIKPLLHPEAVIKSDENPHYPGDVQKHFGPCLHRRYKGRRGSIGGQGELKKIGFDPLFSLNHTCAMFRANINRLFRRTWCTTKKKDRLELHLALYSLRHNKDLIPRV